jgi:hypothetical protein
MSIRDDSREIVAARELPASRPSFRRSLVPMLYAGIGVALGTLTGLSMTMIGAPSGSPSEYHAATTSSAPASAITVSMSAQSTPTAVSSPASNVKEAGTTNLSADEGKSATTRLAGSATKAGCTGEAGCSHKVDVAPGKIPAANQQATPERTPAKARQPRSLIHPFARQARPVMASLTETLPVQIDDQQVTSQVSQNDDTNAASQFYTEGDLTVADYDATEGTIQTSDGRTFVVGASVSMANATSWDDYRSSVHYRCGGNGSCMLERAGVLAPNAKAI